MYGHGRFVSISKVKALEDISKYLFYFFSLMSDMEFANLFDNSGKN